MGLGRRRGLNGAVSMQIATPLYPPLSRGKVSTPAQTAPTVFEMAINARQRVVGASGVRVGRIRIGSLKVGIHGQANR